MSIARARRIAEAFRQQFNYVVETSVTIETVGKADILVLQDGQPVRIVLLTEPQPSELQAFRTVADVSVVPDGDTVPSIHYQKSGRGRWLHAFGSCRSLADWARDERCVVPEKSLRRRVEEGWEAERAIAEPAKKLAAKKSAARTDDKPYPDFPLQKHPSGQWCKKIEGKLYYFGSGEWREALKRFHDEHDSIRLGRRIVETPTVSDLVNDFLRSKESQLEKLEVSVRTWNDYKAMCARIVEYFGANTQVGTLTPQRFAAFRIHLGKGVSVVTLGNRIRMIRVVFRHAFKSRFVATEIDMANCFELPPAKATRTQRWQKSQLHGFKMFSAEDIASLLEVAQQPLRAMILLGINCGLGNTDCSELTRNALNLQRRWLTFPRPKTMVMRECPLWPETAEALADAMEKRPAARSPEFENRVFLTCTGRPWVKVTKNGANDDEIAKEFSKLLNELLMKRPGINFYALRHTFQTIGEQAGDMPAVRFMMGHVDASMSGVYREFISEERLWHVVNYIRSELLSPQQDVNDLY